MIKELEQAATPKELHHGQKSVGPAVSGDEHMQEAARPRGGDVDDMADYREA